MSEPVLFYMPHCDASLYSDVLDENWSKDALACVAVLGNSFAHMQVSTPKACNCSVTEGSVVGPISDKRTQILQSNRTHREWPLACGTHWLQACQDSSCEASSAGAYAVGWTILLTCRTRAGAVEHSYIQEEGGEAYEGAAARGPQHRH